MKTPYDAALRLRQREIDAMRISISTEVNQMTVLDRRRRAIDSSVRAEIDIASGQHIFPPHAFVARMRAEHEALGRERATRNERLASLRAEAVEAFGSLSALDAAANRHRDELLRSSMIAEQSQSDDFSASRFTRTLYAERQMRASST